MWEIDDLKHRTAALIVLTALPVYFVVDMVLQYRRRLGAGLVIGTLVTALLIASLSVSRHCRTTVEAPDARTAAREFLVRLKYPHKALTLQERSRESGKTFLEGDSVKIIALQNGAPKYELTLKQFPFDRWRLELAVPVQ